MITKQQIIDEVQKTTDLDQEIRDALVMELSSYPDSLSNEDITKFDAFMMSIQEEELVTGQALMDAADAADTFEEKMVALDEESAEKTARVFSSATESINALSLAN